MMPKLFAIALSSLLPLFPLLLTSTTRAAEPTAEQLEFFETKIRPVLVKHCYECHSSKQPTPRGGLRVDDREALLKGGDSGASIVGTDPAKSPLIQALRYDGLEMPPKGKLPDAVIADFVTWVKQGAPDPRTAASVSGNPEGGSKTAKGENHWAFKRPVNHQPPTVKDSAWPANDVDRFVLAKLEEHNLHPTTPADRRTLIRRAYFDLIGLPPEPEKVEAFKNDPASDTEAFAKIVDELLASTHYGERWARYWLDVARYGEDQAHTFKARNYPRGYLYRDWVVNAFNTDLPYDSFLRHQIAGDLVEDATPPKHERLPALGLFALGPVYYQDNGEKDKALADEWDDRVDTLIRGTQALTISCARCHDHKFDPLSMTDYYGLLGVFASTQYVERPAVAESIVLAKQKAETAVKEQQLMIDRALAAEARNVREQLVPEIPKYVSAAWQVIHSGKKKKNDEKKFIAELVKKTKLNEDLIRRWVAYLEEKPESGAVKAERPYLDAWRKLRKSQDSDVDLSSDEKALAEVAAIGEGFRQQAVALLPRRKELSRAYGEDMAFIAESDRATVEAGTIPLGNLFDDAKGTQLSSALSSDPFRSTASENSLGVARVVQAWGHQTAIATGINFDFQTLGSSDRGHGAITNDGWDPSGGIRTTGKSVAANSKRMEQGIGMHANALITFDLDEIRRAGLIPSDRTMTFKVDRAGLNDDSFGSAGSVHLAVIVTQPHQKPSEFDAVLFASLNGQPAKVDENDGAYYFAGKLPDPLLANGKFAEIEVSLSPQARYLTLVATGAAKPGEENSISSDHAVFSGARIEFVPNSPSQQDKPNAIASTEPTGNGTTPSGTDAPPTVTQGLFHSELFSDKGLLAIPSKDVGAYLSGEPAERLAKMNSERDVLKKAADQITVSMAHALSDGQGLDMPVYLAGDPKKKGAVATRGMPAVLTGADRVEFKPKGSGRLELAQAITSRDNPLTARVWVNRVWAGHFGAGLVRTPSNFGTLGERPSHPELLDWLAVKFMESGWSLKKLHREIMLSATYRLRNSPNDADRAAIKLVDAENRFLSFMPRRRLEVEPWRDAVLTVSGNLDRTLGGPSSNLSNGNNRRRTLYGFVSRHELDELLRLFDFPDPNITAGQRTVTTVPLQQLFVLNSDFMVNQSKAFAARLAREATTDDARIRRAFQLLFNREPSEVEQQLGQQFVNSSSETTKLTMWEQYTLALMGSNEFLFVD